ncbi:unnamed protein product [Symbiodinium sp. CCMP2592]|nr:unnamed protein product [Symbiodinium sp. CCMP2592]
MSLDQLHPGERCTRKDTRPTRLVPRQQQRLRIVTWNCGGLSGPRYHEVITWLRDEHQAGRTVDICCLQETHWKEEMEYTTADEAGELAWHVVNYPGKDSSGLMCLVRAGLVPPTHIRTVCLVPGRVVHLRLCFQVPLDVLCMYQYSWNTQKLELTGTHKVEALLKQRRQIWRTLDQWLQGIPQRHGCVVLGDLNTPLIPDNTVAGSGVVSDRAGQQQDQQELQELLRNHRCCALNTWARRGSTAPTFIPPSTKGKEPGSQIDFVITRGNLLDPEAKRARPVATPFVPTSGGRHRPVIATIPLPTRPTTKAGDNHGLRPRQIRKALADTTMATQVGEAVRNRLECMQPTDAIDDQLLEGWRAVRGQFPTNDTTRPVPCPQHATLTVCVRHLWQLRDDVRKATQTLGTWTSPRRMATRALQAWVLLFRLNSHNRELRKECRRRKTNRIEEVVLSDNIHQAAKRFAPKAPRKRLQLRDANGGIQTHEAEFEQIKTYFAKLYAGPVPDQVVLSKGPLISVDEVLAAMHRLQAGKAMPHKSAPAALWKHFSQEVAPILSAQFNLYLAPGTTSLPRSWCISDLILIPKPGKAMKTPGDLRPLSLLSLPAKALASVVASRLQEYVIRYLREVPQFAYVPGRTLAQALERVFAHCAAVRVALQQGHNTVHAKRQGHKMASICGGCMLSLDVSKAYDCVSRQHLEAALRDAEVPEYLIELTLLIHHTACLRISHCELETVLPTFRGLRQGCSLSPTLWALLTGWMLRQMEDPGVASIMSANTTYADDQHYAWQVGSGLELEAAYAAMKHILHSLRRFGLQISADKTVILMELRGLHAHKALQRYVVDMPQGKCVKFLLDGEATYIRIVTSHVYLGAVIGYHKFETDTLQHRMKLAKGVYSRLGNILRHRSLPLRLRLLLWQGCVWPTLLHALDSSGLPGKDLNTMLVLLLKQARSIARSHSMLTKETNRSIIDRLRLPDPVRRLQQALTRREQSDSALGNSVRPGPSQLQWRTMVRGHLFDSACVWHARPVEGDSVTKLCPVTLVVHEQFECEVCGQCFSTQAAQRRHMYLTHLTQEQQQQQRDDEVKSSLTTSAMDHSVDGMPTCKHCKHKFCTWHAFNYHISSQSCEGLRNLHNQQQTDRSVPQSDALIASDEILQLAGDCTWQQLALHPAVQAKHHHCPECNHWSSTPQYVKRHMLSQHPECREVIETCMEAIKGRAPLTSLQLFNMEDESMQNPDELATATAELDLLRTLAPQVLNGSSSPPTTVGSTTSNEQLEERPQKWQKPGQKGQQGGQPKGKGKGPKSAHSANSSKHNGWGRGAWSNQVADHQTNQWPEDNKPITRAEFAQMKTMLNMVTTLVIRHEIQQNICRLDSGFMLFIQTTTPDSLAHSTYQVGTAWHQMKQNTPEKLSQPMRVVLFQHLLVTVKQKFEAMMATPSSRSMAEGLGWISATGDAVYGLRWNAETMKHEKDPNLPSLRPAEIKEALDELLKLSVKPMVIHRYHATRQMSETYSSPTLAMMIEVGARLEEAQLVWKRLHLLSQSAAWTAAGCFLRHERLKLGALGNFCYMNVILKCLCHVAFHLGDWKRFFRAEALEFLQWFERSLQVGTVHLWQSPTWVHMLQNWGEPLRQHDAAEFLQFVRDQRWFVPEDVTLTWQARYLDENGQAQTADGGDSLPLLVQPPTGWPENDDGLTISVQRLVEQWQNQDCKHAMLTPAKAFILQVGRFHRDSESGITTKRRHRVVPSRFLDVPVFREGLGVRPVLYQLVAVVLHIGSVPFQGHYQALLYDIHDSEAVYFADDGTRACRISPARVQDMCRDTYLFCYCKCL